MSRFQLILLIVFGAFILIAVLLFSFMRGGSNSGQVNVTIWGSIPQADFYQMLQESKIEAPNKITYTYKEVAKESIETDFTEALAIGKAPDLIILPQSSIWKERNKLFLVPYASVSEQNYNSSFIDEGRIFLVGQGIIALPLYVDPMVLYWNRDIFAKAALVKPISFWDEIYAATQKLNVKDQAGNLTTSTIALGETRNIAHSKDIVSLLMLQAGTPITENQSQGLVSQIANNFDLPVAPGNAAVDFYTQFSDPAKPFYTWNRSMLPAQTSFISGDSAMYLGFASEERELRAKNPNLNLGISQVPQSRVSGKAITYGRLYGVAISRSTTNPAGAMSAALLLVGNTGSHTLSNILRVPPARRDILGTKPQEESMSIFYDAAIQSKGWLDPDTTKTDKVFTTLIDSVTSGRARTSEAMYKADSDLRAIIVETR